MGEVIQDLSHEAANSKERSSRKLHLAGNDIVGSFRKSKEKLIGSRSPRKGGKGAAPVAAISAGVAPKAPAVSGEREQTEISLSGRSSGDLDHKADQATSLETTPFTESEADEEPLPSLAIPAAVLAVGPTATTDHLPAEEGAASSGKPLLGGGSPPAEPATHAATFELGEGASPGRRLSGLSTAHVPVVEWSSLVGHRFLGSGEFCTVSSATLDGKQVAVKVLREAHRDNPLAISDLEAEMQIMISLRHPSILRVLGFGETSRGLPFLVLEILDSVLSSTLPKPAGEVSFWVRRRSVKAWPLQRALQCGIELAEVLRYLHNEAAPGFQLLHRDLKPDNMGFRADGSLVLFDFGLSKLVRIKTGTTAHKLTGQTGAIRYMSPEVNRWQPYGTSAELYSFAIILWQLLSHEVPYAGLGSAAFHRRVIQEGARPPLNKAWPAALSQLLSECWSPTPSERPAIEEVCRRLREIHDRLKP